jgi:diguanylate cyclase (GGDEF)-like protein
MNDERTIWILSDQSDLTDFLKNDLTTDSIHLHSYTFSQMAEIKEQIRHYPPDLFISCYKKFNEILPLANREKIPLILLTDELNSRTLTAYDAFPVVNVVNMDKPFHSIRPIVSDFFNDQTNHANSKILIVIPDEEESVLFRNISHIYKYSATYTDSYEKADELLETKPFDLLIVDVDSPADPADYFLRNLRNRDTYLPILALSGGDERVMRHRLFDLGVNDFIHKPFQIDAFNLKVAGFLRTVLSMKAIKKLSEVDYLTQILNRRSFYDQVLPYINLAQRQKQPFSVIITDIDHFKRINDTYGHDMGDKILVESARVFRDNLRNYDILARFGGEEFVIFISNVDELNAVYVAEKLRKGFKKSFAERLENPVTVSLGVSTWTSGPVEIDELISRADKALYVSKNSGRDKVTHFRNLL